MRIGFGATLLARGLNGGGLDGIGSYARDLGRALIEEGGVSLTPVTFGGSLPFDALPGSLPSVRLAGFPPQALASACSSTAFPGSRKLAEKIDLFHSTDHLVPRLRGVPVLASVMDAVPLSHPEWVNKRLGGLKAFLWRRTMRWADHVITISEFSKGEIVEHFGIDESHVSVIPLGVNPSRFGRLDRAIIAGVLDHHGISSNFFLFVGTLQPRKNLERVLDAHARLPVDVQSSHPLVVVGRPGWGCDGLVTRLQGLESSGRVRWLRYLPDTEVRALMQSADALVFPSLYEGFGLPVVEAFAAGLPVITSCTTALPEVAGDAALLVDPLDVDEIAAAMQRVIEDEGCAASLREKGLARARELTWSECARKTAEIYQYMAG